jgi:hypothetical protein
MSIRRVVRKTPSGMPMVMTFSKIGVRFAERFRQPLRQADGLGGDAVAAVIDSSVGAFVAALRPTTAANRCAGKKLNATGKKVKTKLGCHGNACRKGVGKRHHHNHDRYSGM